MRNLKRALSLALACVMLLGMMVMGTSASTFNDADSIVNKEAVEIAAGLGLFAGTDGNFMPTGTVTRAQMATIIVKMLYGSDFNADSYKGMNTFSDIAAFEGGWAEGYINACVAAKVVGGYGDGTFKPGNPVTTAEALTMIINALKVDAGEGTWPMTVMAKAEEMKLFGELSPKPQTNVALTRDALAVICIEGLNYSPAGTKGYVVAGIKDTVFADYLEAWIAAGQDNSKISSAAQDTLATTVFELKSVEGFVVSNQATGYDFTLLNNGQKFAIETGLDMIGHYVTVYYAEAYTSEYEPGVAYAVVDESTTIVVAEAIEADRADFRAAFGSKPIFGDGYEFDGGYNMGSLEEALTVSGFSAGSYDAPAGTYVVYEGEIVAYIAPTTVYATKVSSVDTTAGRESITLADGLELDNAEDSDEVVEYEGIAKDDYVTYVIAQGQVVLTKAEKVTGVISNVAVKDEKTYVSVDGTAYPVFTGVKAGLGLTTDLTSGSFNFDGEYDVYLTANGKFIGCTAAEGAADVSNIAYLLGAFAGNTTKDAYGRETTYVYAQGVNADGEEAMITIGASINGENYGVTSEEDIAAVTEGFYVVKDGNTKDLKKYEIQILDKCEAGYNADTNPYFIGSNRYATTDSANIVISSGTVYAAMHICTAACPAGNGTGISGHSANYVTSFYNASSKILVVDGDLQDELKTAVIAKANIDYKIPQGMEQQIPYLYTKDASGNTQVVMILLKADPNNLNASTDPIYVAANQTSSIGKDANGYLFEVYEAKTGALINLTLDTNTISAGLWNYSVDDETGLAELTSEIETNVEDGAYNMNMTFQGVFTSGSTKRITFAGFSSSNGDTCGAAKVVDLRSKEQMVIDGVDEITNLDRIQALRDMGKLVVVDVIGSSTSAVGALYVKKVVSAPTEPQLLYMPSAAITANAVYDAYTLDGINKEIFVSEICETAGFVYYMYDGSAFLVSPIADDENFYSSENIVSIADGKMTTTNLTNIDVSSARVIDLSGNGFETIDELAAAAEGYTLYIGAYVEDGAADAIFVVNALNFVNGEVLYASDKFGAKGTHTLYKLNGEKVELVIGAALSGAPNVHRGGGFYKITLNPANGQVTGASKLSAWYYLDGSYVDDGDPAPFTCHNNIISYDPATRTLVTADDYAAFAGHSSGSATCGFSCGISGTIAEMEPDTLVLADDVVIVDARTGELLDASYFETNPDVIINAITPEAGAVGAEATFVAIDSYYTNLAASWFAEN